MPKAAGIVVSIGLAAVGWLGCSQPYQRRSDRRQSPGRLTRPHLRPGFEEHDLVLGRNDRGQLGNGTTDTSAIPLPVPGLTGVTSLWAGDNHTRALLRDGRLRCWGENDFGQLGNPASGKGHSPVPLDVIF